MHQMVYLQLSCTYPEVIDQVKVGHRIFIDDGKIEALVRSSNEQYLELDVISPKGITTKIKSNKGINFPDSCLKMPTLTADDIRNLDFVVNRSRPEITDAIMGQHAECVMLNNGRHILEAVKTLARKSALERIALFLFRCLWFLCFCFLNHS